MLENIQKELAESETKLQQKVEDTDTLKKELLEKENEIGKNCEIFLWLKFAILFETKLYFFKVCSFTLGILHL